jgi:hypothetical protein
MFSESWVGMEFHSYPAFLLMKSAAPNTPNKNQNTPKEIFVTPRVLSENS